MSECYLKEELFSLARHDDLISELLHQAGSNGIRYWDLENPDNEWVNDQFWETLGYDPNTERPMASEWQDLIFPDDLQQTLNSAKKHCADPSHCYDQVARYKHRGGQTLWIRCRGIAVRDDKGRPTRMLEFHTDETERFEAEKQMALLRERLELATDAAGIAIWDFDVTNNKLTWDDRMFVLYRKDKETFAGEYADWLACLHAEDMQKGTG